MLPNFETKKFSNFSLFLGNIGYQGGLDVNKAFMQLTDEQLKALTEKLLGAGFFAANSTPADQVSAINSARLDKNEKAIADFILFIIQNDAAQVGEHIRDLLQIIADDAAQIYSSQQKQYANLLLLLIENIDKPKIDETLVGLRQALSQLENNTDFKKVGQIGDGNCAFNTLAFGFITTILFTDNYQLVDMTNLWVSIKASLDIVRGRHNPLLQPFIDFAESRKDAPSFEEFKGFLQKNCQNKETLDAAIYFLAPALRTFWQMLAPDRIIKIHKTIAELKQQLANLPNDAQHEQQRAKITKQLNLEEKTLKSIIVDATDRVSVSPSEILPVATKLQLHIAQVGKSQVTADNYRELAEQHIYNAPTIYMLPSAEDTRTGSAYHWDALVTSDLIVKMDKILTSATLVDSSKQYDTSSDFENWHKQQLKKDSDFNNIVKRIQSENLDESTLSELLKRLDTITEKYNVAEFEKSKSSTQSKVFTATHPAANSKPTKKTAETTNNSASMVNATSTASMRSDLKRAYSNLQTHVTEVLKQHEDILASSSPKPFNQVKWLETQKDKSTKIGQTEIQPSSPLKQTGTPPQTLQAQENIYRVTDTVKMSLRDFTNYVQVNLQNKNLAVDPSQKYVVNAKGEERAILEITSQPIQGANKQPTNDLLVTTTQTFKDKGDYDKYLVDQQQAVEEQNKEIEEFSKKIN